MIKQLPFKKPKWFMTPKEFFKFIDEVENESVQ